MSIGKQFFPLRRVIGPRCGMRLPLLPVGSGVLLSMVSMLVFFESLSQLHVHACLGMLQNNAISDAEL